MLKNKGKIKYIKNIKKITLKCIDFVKLYNYNFIIESKKWRM